MIEEVANKWIWIVGLVFTWLGVLGPGAPTALADSTTSFRILSYNVHGLPEPIVGDHGQYARIGDILAERRKQGTAPQIVVIQEGWSFSGTAATLIEHAGYPYVVHGSTASGHLLTSGIHILSEFPFEIINRMNYHNCASWDCQATKGALHVRIHVPGVPVPIDIYNTHLNSDPDTDPFATVEECKDVRMHQLSDLAEFVGQTSSHQSIVFAPGDYNSVPGSDELLWFYGLTMAQEALQYCSRTGTTCASHGNDVAQDGKDAIDHQFFSSGYDHGKLIRVKPTYYERNFTEIFKGEPLSDHLGLEVQYQISW